MVDDWISIESKYANKCITCGNMVEIGERVLWLKGSGIRHDPICEDTVGIQEDNTAPIIIIDEKEWSDFKQYSYKELQTVINCQYCGKSLNHKDVWIENDRKTCEACHK